jgi:chemotaxis protein methyltransferase CheR
MKLYPRLLSLGMTSFGDYFHYIKYEDSNDEEKTRMIALLANNETYFLREHAQLEVLRDQILPKIREDNIAANDKSLTILSAGCSTGEEVYSLALLTLETGMFLWDWDVNIIGGDISRPALQTARAALYGERSLRTSDPERVKSCYSKESGKYKVKKHVRKLTKFVRLNLIDPDSWRGLGKFDVVLCRNVLIYFSNDTFKRAIDNIHHCLRGGGYLLLGHSETLTRVSDDFVPERFSKTVVYRKKGE